MTRFCEPLENRWLCCDVTATAPRSADLVDSISQTKRWYAGPSMPAALGEVAAGEYGRKVYVVGETNPATFVYSIPTNTWTTGAPRPHPGNHHAAEVVNGKFYLFGGLTAGSDGRVQIYDPAVDAWTQGGDMPFAAGSSSSALIGGQVYVAGGIVGDQTTDRLARYDPAANAWTELAPMPQGRNHTAAGTDGQKFYVFGGRGPGSGDRNVTTNGFDTTQVYDPATNTWQSSLTSGSTLAPLPQARGGMGKAVFVDGEFYVIGGETLTGADATAAGVYRRVDVYDPVANAWRAELPMPTARHGIFPVAAGGQIFVAGGGVKFGGSQSAVLEALVLATPPPPPMTPPPVPAVAGRFVFYNNSVFDGNDPAVTAADDAAVATDKFALVAPPAGSLAPPTPASFANYTSYERGLNGIMVDVANLSAAAAPTVADFVFEIGNPGPSGTPWAPAPAPGAVTLRRGAGVFGADRITITWPDGQIEKTWLRVRVAATANTGLAADDVFYFGNWPGEAGNKPGDTRVNKTDAKLATRNRTRRGRRPVAAPPPVTSAFDFNRDGVVDVLDRRIAARNKTSRKTFLILIDAG